METTFNVNGRVYIKHFQQKKDSWVSARVISRKGKVLYKMQAGEKYVVHHANQIRKFHEID